VVLAGKEYGTGSSRDWAAKGTMLLGVKAVIAESFERIHRSNLIGMGVLPCQFTGGQNAQSLGLTGREVFDFGDLQNADARTVVVTATGEGAAPIQFEVRVRIDTPKEREYYRHGGILQYVLRQLAGTSTTSRKPSGAKPVARKKAAPAAKVAAPARGAKTARRRAAKVGSIKSTAKAKVKVKAKKRPTRRAAKPLARRPVKVAARRKAAPRRKK
jgi:aconitate hydratase